MKIIGHRGARGSELENSLASIQKALALQLDAIEFDIHRTSDDQLVVMHDATTKRTADSDVRIADISLVELQKIHLQNGETIPTLAQVLEIAGAQSLYIDIKDPGSAPLLIRLLGDYPAVRVTIVSRLGIELKAIHSLSPDIPTYMYFLKAENPVLRPIHMVKAAQRVQATGLGLDKLIVNPVTYLLARRRGLKLYAYPFKSMWGAKLFHRVYPHIDIMTSNPEKLNCTTFFTP